ncbi:MAG: HyaD/HybD family hydrogenase maturation endopeptidase [Thermacetogeniaceae bacterium]
MGKKIVLGIGNLLLKDEGIGVHLVRALEDRQLPPDVDVIDGGTAGCDLLPLLSGAEKIIIVDALKGGEPPGAVYRLTPQDFQQQAKYDVISLHDIGIMDALKMLELMDGYLPAVVIIGVEPGQIEVGLDLTPEVSASLPFILDLVMKEIAG